MPTYGLTSTGWVIKDLATILSEIEADQRASMGADLDVSVSTPLGVNNGIIAAKLAELWQQGGAIYNSQYPDGAEGLSLDNVLQMTGVRRLPYSKSSATATMVGTPGTVFLPGYDNTRAKNPGNNSLWVLALPAGLTSLVIPGGGSITANFIANEYGPVAALAGSLNVKDTPISGWTSVTNAQDAALGRDVETDAAARVRRTGLLSNPGSGTVDAIYAKVLRVTDITYVRVYENYTNATDVNGLPAKSVEVIALGGANNDIAQAIWNSKDAGISAFGNTTGTALDALSGTRIVGFSRPTLIPIYVALTSLTGTGYSGLTADIAKALTAFGSTLNIGDDVIRKRLLAASFDPLGVIDNDLFYTGTTPSPVGTANIPIGYRELATFDTSQITVTLT